MSKVPKPKVEKRPLELLSKDDLIAIAKNSNIILTKEDKTKPLIATKIRNKIMKDDQQIIDDYKLQQVSQIMQQQFEQRRAKEEEKKEAPSRAQSEGADIRGHINEVLLQTNQGQNLLGKPLFLGTDLASRGKAGQSPIRTQVDLKNFEKIVGQMQNGNNINKSSARQFIKAQIDTHLRTQDEFERKQTLKSQSGIVPVQPYSALNMVKRFTKSGFGDRPQNEALFTSTLAQNSNQPRQQFNKATGKIQWENVEKSHDERTQLYKKMEALTSQLPTKQAHATRTTIDKLKDLLGHKIAQREILKTDLKKNMDRLAQNVDKKNIFENQVNSEKLDLEQLKQKRAELQEQRKQLGEQGSSKRQYNQDTAPINQKIDQISKAIQKRTQSIKNMEDSTPDVNTQQERVIQKLVARLEEQEKKHGIQFEDKEDLARKAFESVKNNPYVKVNDLREPPVDPMFELKPEEQKFRAEVDKMTDNEIASQVSSRPNQMNNNRPAMDFSQSINPDPNVLNNFANKPNYRDIEQGLIIIAEGLARNKNETTDQLQLTLSQLSPSNAQDYFEMYKNMSTMQQEFARHKIPSAEERQIRTETEELFQKLRHQQVYFPYNDKELALLQGGRSSYVNSTGETIYQPALKKTFYEQQQKKEAQGVRKELQHLHGAKEAIDEANKQARIASGKELTKADKYKNIQEQLKKHLGVEGDETQIGEINIYDFVKFVHQLSEFNSKISGSIDPSNKKAESYVKQTTVFTPNIEKKEPTNFNFTAQAAYKLRPC